MRFHTLKYFDLLSKILFSILPEILFPNMLVYISLGNTMHVNSFIVVYT